MGQNQEADRDKQKERRKRRKQNQIIAYVTLLVMIALAAAGIVLGVKFITEKGRTQSREENSSKVDEILGTEETIEIQQPTQPPQSEPAEPTAEQKLDEIVNACIEVMPLEDKVAGLFMITPEALTGVGAAVKAGEGTQTALAQYAVGGLIYFSKNIESAEQLKQMIDNTKLYSKYPLLIGVDEEGGSVSRVAEAGIAKKEDSAANIGATADANNAYLAGNAIGSYLAPLGFNLDFAPSADIANVENSIMAGRAYGADAASVSPFMISMMKGLEESKVTACLKHFPGIGSTDADTHKGMVTSEKTAEEFRANELAVFQAGIDAGANMIMVSHMSVPGLAGDNTPSSLSKAVVTDILRGEMKFNGVVITDAMNMQAISEYYEPGEAAVMALKAGCDMILMPSDFKAAYEGVLEAVQNGTLAQERINDSLKRIYRIKYADKVTAQ